MDQKLEEIAQIIGECNEKIASTNKYSTSKLDNMLVKLSRSTIKEQDPNLTKEMQKPDKVLFNLLEETRTEISKYLPFAKRFNENVENAITWYKDERQASDVKMDLIANEIKELQKEGQEIDEDELIKYLWETAAFVDQD